MKKERKQLFFQLDAEQIPADLPRKILLRIEQRERRILGVKIACFSVSFAASMSFVIFGFISFNAQLAQSGFPQFIGLFFTDFGTAAANFPDFALSIAESFPVFSAAIVLIGSAAAIWSVAGLIDDAAMLRNRHFSFK